MTAYHTPDELIDASFFARIGGCRDVYSVSDLAEGIETCAVRVRMYLRTLATEETEDIAAEYDETVVADEWYDASRCPGESAKDFALRIWGARYAPVTKL